MILAAASLVAEATRMRLTASSSGWRRKRRKRSPARNEFVDGVDHWLSLTIELSLGLIRECPDSCAWRRAFCTDWLSLSSASDDVRTTAISGWSLHWMSKGHWRSPRKRRKRSSLTTGIPVRSNIRTWHVGRFFRKLHVVISSESQQCKSRWPFASACLISQLLLWLSFS